MTKNVRFSINFDLLKVLHYGEEIKIQSKITFNWNNTALLETS
jgi:hypothetical protein